MAAAVEEGSLVDAARALTRLLANDEEMAALEASGHFPETARYVAVQLEELDQAAASAEPGPTHPSVLAAVSAPVLVLRGTRTALPDWLHEAARYIEEHVEDVRVRDVAGVGHFGVALAPEPIAEELLGFFDAAAPA